MRYQLPALSPISWRAIWSGVSAAISQTHGFAAKKQVEAALHARMGGAQVLLTDSGTSALTLALRCTDRGRHRPVAVPAYGCFDLATAVVGAGERFVLYDVDPSTLSPSRESLTRALDLGADRIIVAHLYGFPVDMTMVRELAKAAGALIIDDAAQGVGASYDGLPLGVCGDIGVLSFGRGKGITAGRGGALVWMGNQFVSAEHLQADTAPAGTGWIPEFVRSTAQLALGRPALYALPAALPFLRLGETEFKPPHEISEASSFSLGVLRETIHLADAETKRRHENALRLMRALDTRILATPVISSGAVPGYLRLPVVDVGAEKAGLSRDLPRRLGVMGGYPKALPDLEGFGSQSLNSNDSFDGARQLATQLFTLPVHSAMSEADLRRLEGWISAYGRED